MRSLLFTSPKIKSSPDFICEDLKLDLLFPPEVLEIFLFRPTSENITRRREMFAELLKSPSLYDGLSELQQILLRASELYRSLNRAICEAADIYVFPHLFSAVSEFSHKASCLSAHSAALSEFSEEFKALCALSEFQEAEGVIPELINELKSASVFFIKTDQGNARLQKENDSDITSALLECARELNIELQPKDSGKVVLQKGLAEGIQRLNPTVFEKAAVFYKNYRTLISGEIFEYLNELKFILNVTDFTRNAENSGLPCAFPEISKGKELHLSSVYDITLLKKEGTVIVPNDINFTENEPFFYLTGANGGGKTTYLRAVGCAVLMFSAGAPVFCEGGECPVFDSVLTHFPRDERFEGSGRFFDEIRRVDELLTYQSGNSLILLNETYATTGEDKAREYTDDLARRLYQSGNFGLYITHQHDVKEAQIPFLGVVVDESDSNRRTYRIEKRRLPPKSFAKDILEKYGLTRERLKELFKEKK